MSRVGLVRLGLVGLGLAGCAVPGASGTAPAAAPEPGRTVIIADEFNLIFFDTGSATLTPRARQVLREIAERWQRFTFHRIIVEGHADRAGPATANLRLSERRAEAAAAELDRLGLPRAAMEVTGYGETRPLIPTPDGVAQPINRRVVVPLR